MSTFKLDCDNVNSASVANPLSNEELNDSKLVNLSFTDELNVVIEYKLPLNVVAIEELIDEDIKTCDADKDELITATSISVAISLYPIVPVINICDEPDTIPSGNTAATSPVIIPITDCEKSAPTSADVCSAEPLSICFNLIKFAIYLNLPIT
jgi:hypothetical protein